LGDQITATTARLAVTLRCSIGSVKARTGCVQRELVLFVCGALPIQRVGELGARAEKEPGP